MALKKYNGWDVDVDNLNVRIFDHFGGFSESLDNDVLNQLGSDPLTIYSEYIFNQSIKDKYKNFNFVFDLKMWVTGNFMSGLSKYKNTPNKKEFKNFICSFNGSDSISRRLLTSALYKFNWVNPNYFSKNFTTFKDGVDGSVMQFLQDSNQDRFYRKFIVHDDDNFYESVLSHQYYQYNHSMNMTILHDKIQDSFLQIVGETTGTCYHPFVTEKIFYPIISNTFWLTYAQPGYHNYIEKHFGFKLYDKIFDYTFDQIQNPVIRLVELLTMVSKFEKLTPLDWDDLYLLEQDAILYNYDHYYSGDYLKKLMQFQ